MRVKIEAEDLHYKIIKLNNGYKNDIYNVQIKNILEIKCFQKQNQLFKCSLKRLQTPHHQLNKLKLLSCHFFIHYYNIIN